MIGFNARISQTETDSGYQCACQVFIFNAPARIFLRGCVALVRKTCQLFLQLHFAQIQKNPHRFYTMQENYEDYEDNEIYEDSR